MKRKFSSSPVVIALAIAGVCTAAAGFALFLFRMPLAGWAIETYLATRGVPSHVRVLTLEPNHVEATLQIGNSDRPDLSLQNLEIFLSWHGFQPTITRVHIEQAVVRGSYRRGRIHFGTLSALIRSFSKGTPHTHFSLGELPDIFATSAQVLLNSDYGTLRIDGGGAVRKGHLVKLWLTTAASRLRGPGFDIRLQRADLFMHGKRLALKANATVDLRAGVSDLPAGKVRIAVSAEGLSTNALLDGGAATVRAQARISSNRLSLRNVVLTPLQLDLIAKADITSGTSQSISLALHGHGGMAEETVDQVLAALPAIAREQRMASALTGMMSKFNIDVPRMQITAGHTLRLRLAAPATLSGNGVRLQVAPLTEPLIDWTGSVLRSAAVMTLSGPNVPSIAVTFPVVQIGSVRSGDAKLSLAGKFNIYGVHQVALVAQGHVAWHKDQAAFMLAHCAHLRVGRIRSRGKILVARLVANLCPVSGAPLIQIGGQGWVLEAGLQAASADLPEAAVKLAGASGAAHWSGGKQRLDLQLRLASAKIIDTNTTPRFAPLRLSGGMSFVNQCAHGEFGVYGAGVRLGHVEIIGRLLQGRGRALIHMDRLTFTPGGLQPSSLSTLLSPLRQASGTAEFTGKVVWSQRHVVSGGVLVLSGLDFLSPAGMAHKAHARIRLTSLLPLRTASHQRLTLERIDSTIPMNGIEAQFALDGSILHLDSAKAAVSKGEISLAPFTLSLAEHKSSEGVLRFEKLDLAPLLKASNLADKIKAKLLVSGAIPFRVSPGGIVFINGHLASDDGGRLSIDRSLWSGNQGSAKDNAVRSLAYQALEHLKIEHLEGHLNSLPGGRLELILHVKGRNDPPSPKTANVDLFSLLDGSAFSRPIPLPAGTEVNLTLDTTLNFAELIAAYQKAWAEALRNSAAAH